MTDKVVIPQIGDFVHGQRLTQPGFDALSSLSDKVNALENDSNETINQAILDLQERLSTAENGLEKALEKAPEIVVIAGGSSIQPSNPPFDLYQITADFEAGGWGGGSPLVSIITASSQIITVKQYPVNLPITSSISFTVTRDEIAALTDGSFNLRIAYGSTVVALEAKRWIIMQYKTGA